MRRTIPAVFAVVAVLAFALQAASAQEVSLAPDAEQDSVEVHITGSGDVSVTHVIDKTSSPRQLDLFRGTPHGIEVVNEKDGGDAGGSFAVANGGQGVLLFPSDEKRIVRYGLSDALSQVDGVWTWNVRYLETTKFFFPGYVDMIFVTGTPVMLGERKAINCHGCQMILEYFEDADVQTEVARWEDREFAVRIVSLEKVGSFAFDQPGKSLRFETAGEGRPITVVLPQELLGKPYQVFLNDEKIIKHDHISNGTHAWVSVRPHEAGTVGIVGTTVVPEFSLFLPLILGASLIAVLRYGGRLFPAGTA